MNQPNDRRVPVPAGPERVSALTNDSPGQFQFLDGPRGGATRISDLTRVRHQRDVSPIRFPRNQRGARSHAEALKLQNFKLPSFTHLSPNSHEIMTESYRHRDASRAITDTSPIRNFRISPPTSNLHRYSAADERITVYSTDSNTPCISTDLLSH